MSATAEKPVWAPKLLKPWNFDPLHVASLETCVKEGGFVPFLGAGASSMRPKETEHREDRQDRRLHEGPWESVCCNLSALLQSLGEKEEKEKKFLRGFAEEYNCTCESATADMRTVQQDTALLDLQRALVRLVTRVTAVFGRHMEEGCMYVSSAQNLVARELVGMGEELEGAIVDSLVATHALKCQDRELFELDKVWNKLVHFAYEHTDEKTWGRIRNQVSLQSKEVGLEETVEKLTDRQFKFKKRGSRLAISEIAWVTQLLWYSLTYQVPAYPTTSELAFRLSLFSQNVPPRVGELAQAAETVADYKDLVDQVRRLFRFYDKRMKGPFGPLQKAVAGALNYAFEKRKRERIYRELLPAIPMALTTNFDMALERAFDSLESTTAYHVVFPIFASEGAMRPSGQQEEVKFPTIVWVIKTVTYYDGGEKSVDWLPWDQQNTEGLVESFEAKGPVIVKLHGSPLEPLEAIPDARLPRHRDYFPCLVLPESTYLEMILQQDSTFPRWINMALKTPKHRQKERSLWFLGYSISDLNVRLRLYQQLYWTFDDPDDPPDLVAVNKEFDLYQSAVFGRLKVAGKEGDLHGVARTLLGMKELAQYVQGRKS